MKFSNKNPSNPSLLIELPTWLGDAVMATAAIENLIEALSPKRITLFGSKVSTEALKAHPKITKTVTDETKKGFNRVWNTYITAKEIGAHDVAISFRSHLFSKFLLFATGSKKIAVFDSKRYRYAGHQVKRYSEFINEVLNIKAKTGDLVLYHVPKSPNSRKLSKKKILGINPGATYGSAKRWYPRKFAQVAAEFSDRFDIVIFGSPMEVEIANEIEKNIIQMGVQNYLNLAGKTDIAELISSIASLDLFITNDSGPMHVAAAYKVPTVAVFGPTDYTYTSQWNNPKSKIVSLDLECAPCMKRVCPLKHHDCMKKLSAETVIEAAQELILSTVNWS